MGLISNKGYCSRLWQKSTHLAEIVTLKLDESDTVKIQNTRFRECYT